MSFSVETLGEDALLLRFGDAIEALDHFHRPGRFQLIDPHTQGGAHDAAAKGNPPKNAGAAFVAYCKKQENLRG